MPLALALGAATACASEPRVRPRQGLPLGMTHVPASERPTNPREAPPALTQLATTVEGLDAGADDLGHRRLIVALRELTDALAVIVPHRAADIDAVRRAANELENSPRLSSMHTDQTLYGLRAALAALLGATPIDPADALTYRATVEALATELDAIDPDRPLLRQHDAIVEGFRTATRSLYVLVGVEPRAGAISRGVSEE